ncbi:hypothetical protein [Pseudomonas asiatica]|uniref:hypothetical protein n=1 Tax=Pseudomonas TaxID=286 RepID=UPI00345D56AE
MKGYWIILGTAVTDTQAQQEYGRLWAPIAEHYGARGFRLIKGSLIRMPWDDSVRHRSPPPAQY